MDHCKLQDLAILESMQLALESIVSSVFDGSDELGESKLALCRTFQGFLLTSSFFDRPSFFSARAVIKIFFTVK